MALRATHAPSSDSGSSEPPKSEEAMGACAIAAPGVSIPRTSANRPRARSQHGAERSTSFTGTSESEAGLTREASSNPLARSGRASWAHRQECWRRVLLTFWLESAEHAAALRGFPVKRYRSRQKRTRLITVVATPWRRANARCHVGFRGRAAVKPQATKHGAESALLRRTSNMSVDTRSAPTRAEPDPVGRGSPRRPRPG